MNWERMALLLYHFYEFTRCPRSHELYYFFRESRTTLTIISLSHFPFMLLARLIRLIDEINEHPRVNYLRFGRLLEKQEAKSKKDCSRGNPIALNTGKTSISRVNRRLYRLSAIPVYPDG